MKWVYTLVAIILGIPIAVFALMYGVSELGGEVVTLQRAEANGQTSDVRIWIVDEDGLSWIEHGDAESHWITQLSSDSNLTLSRAGHTTRYLASPDPQAHDLYHQLRQEKYGIADKIVGTITVQADECPGLPVKLQLIE